MDEILASVGFWVIQMIAFTIGSIGGAYIGVKIADRQYHRDMRKLYEEYGREYPY